MNNRYLHLLFFLSFSFFFCLPSIKGQTDYEHLLISWLKKTSNDTVNFIRVQSLTNKFDYPFKDKKLNLKNDDIYEFYDVRSHADHFLFFLKNDEINFVTNYDSENVLKMYWENWIAGKTKTKRDRLLQGLTSFLYQRINQEHFK